MFYSSNFMSSERDVKTGSRKTFTSFVTGVTFTAYAHLGGEKERQDYVRKSRTKSCLACDDGATMLTLSFTCWPTVTCERD